MKPPQAQVPLIIGAPSVERISEHFRKARRRNAEKLTISPQMQYQQILEKAKYERDLPPLESPSYSPPPTPDKDELRNAATRQRLAKLADPHYLKKLKRYVVQASNAMRASSGHADELVHMMRLEEELRPLEHIRPGGRDPDVDQLVMILNHLREELERRRARFEWDERERIFKESCNRMLMKHQDDEDAIRQESNPLHLSDRERKMQKEAQMLKRKLDMVHGQSRFRRQAVEYDKLAAKASEERRLAEAHQYRTYNFIKRAEYRNLAKSLEEEQV